MFIDQIKEEVGIILIPTEMMQKYGLLDLPNILFEEVSSVDIVIYLFTLCCRDEKTNSYHCTVDYITKTLGCTKKVIDKSLKTLGDTGWFSTTRKGDKLIFSDYEENPGECINLNSEFIFHPDLGYKEKAYILAIQQLLAGDDNRLAPSVKDVAGYAQLSLSDTKKIEESLKAKGLLKEGKLTKEELDRWECEDITRTCEFDWEWFKLGLPKDKEEALINELTVNKEEINRKEMEDTKRYMEKAREEGYDCVCFA